MVITETKIDKMVTTDSISRQGYSINRNDRSSNGGGIVSYIRSTLKPVTNFELQEEAKHNNIEVTVDMITIGPDKKGNKLIIISVY